MTRLVITFILFLSSIISFAEEVPQSKVDELTQAYQREILFLSTYKRELQSKLAGVDKSLGSKLREGSQNLEKLESRWLRTQANNEILMQRLTDLEKDHEFQKENKSLIQATIEQASYTKEIKKTGKRVPLLSQVDNLLKSSVQRLKQSNQIRREPGKYYLKNGKQKEGALIFLGEIARFAEENSRLAALYPSGGGTFKVWKWLGKENALLEKNKLPKVLELFLFENSEKEFIARKEKSTIEVIQSGGIIAWIIVLMGFVALVLSGLRFLLLKKSRTTNQRNLGKVLDCIKENDFESAQTLLLKENNSINRVVGKALSYLKTEPQKVDDAIVEGILDESQIIDRFGMFILVIASVAPLMGLLGTVTGMISTFDIITLYGTGNPKLLSGGISEALVTTMLGLIVAIPSLVVGQYLSHLNERIKTDMEMWSLAACNAYKNRED